MARDLTASPYAQWAANYREQGHHVMPVAPGTKVPSEYRDGGWRPMPGWQKYCDQLPPEFVHTKWETWPEAGVCVAHGAVAGLDLDTDRPDAAQAVAAALEPSPVRRRGAKGWMGYYQPGEGLGDLPGRLRWYDKKSESGSPLVELLLHGTQSVLPPTIHPDTNAPYTWLTDESLADYAPEDLPILDRKAFDALDIKLAQIGLVRQAPRRVRDAEYERPAATDHDLEKPHGRSVNDRAMETDAIDQWWPALDLPKSRQRGVGAWEAVPFWRTSNSGRAVQERNPNLKIVPTGIVDFGADRSYTPIDVVMAARDCSYPAATEWLADYIRAEELAAVSLDRKSAPGPDTEAPQTSPAVNGHAWAATPVFAGKRSFHAITPIREPSDADWEAMVPKEPPSFPIQDMAVCEGLLGEVAEHIEQASATATEAGALAVALPLLGAAFGQAYATPTNLRTNVYTVSLGGSGTGKTSLVAPAKEVIVQSGLSQIMGDDRFASGSGLLTMLRQGPRRVCFLDEFGHMLQQIGSPGAGAHYKQIVTEFTSLYSAANTIFAGIAYADGRDNTISEPHLCLFGMATPDQFWRAFGSASLEDGSIARYLVFPLGKTAPKDMDTSHADAVAESLRYVQGVISGRIAGNLGTPRALTVPLNEYAERARADLKDKESAFALYAEKNAVRGGSAILRRVTENALKIALISAVGRKPDTPEIDQRDMEIGHALAWWSANTMISNIASHIADNQLERDVNDVERFIAEAGGQGRSKEQITRRFRRLRKRDLQEVLEALEEQGSITIERVAGPMGGRPKSTYRAA